MIDVALCMVALVAGGVSLEIFCTTAGAYGKGEAVVEPTEFECGNPS